MSYAEAVHAIFRHRDLSRIQVDPLPLVHYATLASSSHNTQPWKFELSDRKIRIFPDFSRRCPRVDPDDHHLYASLGCATENLVLAARAGGMDAHPHYDSILDCVSVDLEPAVPTPCELFNAIPERRCTRASFFPRSVSARQLRALDSSGNGAGIEMRIVTRPHELERIVEFVAAGNEAQWSDREWVRELSSWIRFNEKDALRSGDGLYGKLLGIPPRTRGRFSPAPPPLAARNRRSRFLLVATTDQTGRRSRRARSNGPRCWTLCRSRYGIHHSENQRSRRDRSDRVIRWAGWAAVGRREEIAGFGGDRRRPCCHGKRPHPWA